MLPTSISSISSNAAFTFPHPHQHAPLQPSALLSFLFCNTLMNSQFLICYYCLQFRHVRQHTVCSMVLLPPFSFADQTLSTIQTYCIPCGNSLQNLSGTFHGIFPYNIQNPITPRHVRRTFKAVARLPMLIPNMVLTSYNTTLMQQPLTNIVSNFEHGNYKYYSIFGTKKTCQPSPLLYTSG